MNAQTGIFVACCCMLALGATAAISPDTLVPTTGGFDVPISHCMYATDLRSGLADMSDELQSFGVTEKHASDFVWWVESDVAVDATANDTVKCIPQSRTEDMGAELGSMIASDVAGERPDDMGMEDTARWVGSVRNATPFEFDGRARDETVHRDEKCCKCRRHHFTWRGERTCGVGPCCPHMCRALMSLQLPGREGVRPCCEKSHQPCARWVRRGSA